MDNAKENKMGNMPMKKLLFTMALPMMISMMIQALYNVVDSVFVAKISENALGAVSLAFPMQNFIIAVSAGTGIGINALLSKSLGQKDFELTNKIASISLFLAFCGWILFCIIGVLFIDIYLEGQTDVQEIIDLGRTYLQICLFGSLGIFFQVISEKLLQSTSLTTHSMIVQGTGAIINIILDPILIFGLFGLPELGITGAALATVIGQFSGAILGIFMNITKNKEITFSIKNALPNKEILKNIFAIAFPSMLIMSIGSIMVFLLNMILTTFSSTAVVAFGACFKLYSFIMMPIFGVTNSIVPIIAYNYGAGNLDRIKECFKYASITAFTFMTVGMLIFLSIPSELLSIFDASEEMLSIGVVALRIVSLCFPLISFNIVCSSAFQSLGNGMYSLCVSVIRQLGVIIPVAYLLSLSGNLNIIWFAFPIAEIVGIGFSLFFLRKITKRVEKDLAVS